MFFQVCKLNILILFCLFFRSFYSYILVIQNEYFWGAGTCTQFNPFLKKIILKILQFWDWETPSACQRVSGLLQGTLLWHMASWPQDCRVLPTLPLSLYATHSSNRCTITGPQDCLCPGQWCQGSLCNLTVLSRDVCEQAPSHYSRHLKPGSWPMSEPPSS